MRPRLTFLTACLVLALGSHCCSAQLTLTAEPSDISAREMGIVRLACRTELPTSAVKVVWNLDGVIVASSSLRSPDPRFRIATSAHDSGSPGVHDLIISPLQMQDQGEYYCQVSEADNSRRTWPKISRKATLRVLRNVDTVSLVRLLNGSAVTSAAAVSAVQAPESGSAVVKQKNVLKIRTGEQLTLVCSSSGSNPAAGIAWLIGDDEDRVDTPTTEGEAGRRFISRPFSGSVRLERKIESPNNKLWSVTSVLQIDSGSILDAHHNLRLQCETQVHGFAERRKSVQSRLYVLVAPQVRIALESASGFVGPTRELREHDNVIAVCRAIGRPDTFAYSWAIDEIGAIPDKTEARLPLTLTRGHNDKRLRCWAENFARGEASIRLRVRYGPKFDQGLPELYAASVGSPEVVFSCEADANPAPQFVWHRAGGASIAGDILGREATLRLRDIRRSDFGQYSCSATAGGSVEFAPITRRVILAENSAPKISTAARHFARLAHNYRLECRINSIPLPPAVDGIVWMRNGKPLVMDARVRIYREDFLGGTTAIVHFDELFSGDFGAYNCTVANGFGNDWQIVTLIMEDNLPVAFIAGASIALLMVLIFVLVLLCVCRKGYWETRAAAMRESSKREVRDITDHDTQKHHRQLLPVLLDSSSPADVQQSMFTAIPGSVTAVGQPDENCDVGSCGGGSSSGCGGSSTQLASLRFADPGGPAAFVPARATRVGFRSLQPSASPSPPLPPQISSPMSLNLMELTLRHAGAAQTILLPRQPLQQQMLIREEHLDENGQEDSVRSCDSGYGGAQQYQQQQQQQQQQQRLHRLHGSDSSVDSSRAQQPQQQHHVTFHPTPCIIHHYQQADSSSARQTPCPMHNQLLQQLSPSKQPLPASSSFGSFVGMSASRRQPPPIVEDQPVSEV